MSTEAEVLKLAKQRVRPCIIAQRVGRTPATVYHYLCKARRAGVDIPKFDTGPASPRLTTLASISAEDTKALRVFAQRRGLTVKDLVAQVVHVVARDSLVAAILDDGGAQ